VAPCSVQSVSEHSMITVPGKLVQLLLTRWFELNFDAELLSDTLSNTYVPRPWVSELLSETWTLTGFRSNAGPVTDVRDDAKEGFMSQTSPIRPSRRIATAYLLEEASILHASTRLGQIILVTGRNAPAITIDSSPAVLCEWFSSYRYIKQPFATIKNLPQLLTVKIVPTRSCGPG
jgi:hypothetical protein